MRIGVDARNLVHNLTGIGRYVLEMCRALSAEGHTLVLYLPEAPYNPIQSLSNCQIRMWDCKGPWRRAIWAMSVLPKAVKEDNLDFFWGPAHRLPAGLSGHIKTILTIHDMVWQKASTTMRWQTWMGEHAFMKASLKRADHIVTVSEASAKDLITFKPDVASRVKVVYPGLTSFPPSGEGSLSPVIENCRHQRYALFVGTLEPRKNLRRLLHAYASISPSKLSDFKLVIAGGQGWGMEDLSMLISHLNIREHVLLTGYVSDYELATLYASAEFLLMPSLYEGFGFPIIEAQSFSVPVITSYCSSMPEVAGSGALFVDPYDENAIADAILQLLGSAEIQRSIGVKGKENSRRFSWENAARELVALGVAS